MTNKPIKKKNQKYGWLKVQSPIKMQWTFPSPTHYGMGGGTN